MHIYVDIYVYIYDVIYIERETDQEQAAAVAGLSAHIDVEFHDLYREKRAARLGQVPRQRLLHDGLRRHRRVTWSPNYTQLGNSGKTIPYCILNPINKLFL